ncbi:MAG: SEL1-like repeat protein [Muribaculaceae bacterium]|nr:SEL1-like repeat protein [Muribaculaceae bacterium]
MKYYNSYFDKFIRVLLFVIIISSVGTGCKKEISLPLSPISTSELESLIEDFNNNDVSWDSFRAIISDSLNYKVVYDWAVSYAATNTTAQFLLGRCYDNGEGVEKNLSKAVELYTKAVD